MHNVITGLLILVFSAAAVDSGVLSFESSGKEGHITVTGTSSLHEWKMDLTVHSCSVQFENEGSELKNIENVQFICRATDLISEYDLMDKKAYDALNADDFPLIKFNSFSTTGLISEGGRFKGNLNGNLTVAGETLKIIIPFSGTIVSKDIIDVNGNIGLKMSDFKIDPPTAMLGTLKTGDNIAISFSLHLKQKVH